MKKIPILTHSKRELVMNSAYIYTDQKERIVRAAKNEKVNESTIIRTALEAGLTQMGYKAIGS